MHFPVLGFFPVPFTCPGNASEDDDTPLSELVVVVENDDGEEVLTCECDKGFIAVNKSICKPSESHILVRTFALHYYFALEINQVDYITQTMRYLFISPHFGPRVYTRGSLVIALVHPSVVRPWSVRPSVFKYLRDCSLVFSNFGPRVYPRGVLCNHPCPSVRWSVRGPS